MGAVYAKSRLADEISVLRKQHEHDKGNGSKKRPVWWHGHYSGPKNKNADSSEKALKKKTTNIRYRIAKGLETLFSLVF